MINDLGWPWRAIMHSVSKHMRLSAPTTIIWMKLDGDPYCRRRKSSQMTLDSDNMRFMRIRINLILPERMRGGSLERAPNKSGVVENVDFQVFRTLRLRHPRKWDQHLVPCRLSSFHRPQNTTLNGHFYRAMHVVLARYCYRKSSVRPSVCLSVRL